MNPRIIRLVSKTLLTQETIKSEDNTQHVFNVLSGILNRLLLHYGVSPGIDLNDIETNQLTDAININAKNHLERSTKKMTSLKVGVPAIDIPVQNNFDVYKWDGRIAENNNYTFVVKSFTHELLWLDTIGDKILISLGNKTEEGFVETSLVALTDNLSIANLKL